MKNFVGGVLAIPLSAVLAFAVLMLVGMLMNPAQGHGLLSMDVGRIYFGLAFCIHLALAKPIGDAWIRRKEKRIKAKFGRDLKSCDAFVQFLNDRAAGLRVHHKH